MALPKQIQRQVEEAEALQSKVAELKQQQQPEPQAQPSTPPEPPSNTEDPAAPVQVEPKPVEQSKPEDWRQKYLTLQGIFNSSVSKLKAENQQLAGQVAELQRRLDELQRPTQGQSLPATGEPDVVTQKDVEEFGQDLVELATRIAKREVSAVERKYADQVAELRKQLDERVSAVQQTQQRTSEEVFFERLGQALPTWEQVQATDECQIWLGTKIPGANSTWNDVLVAAAGRHDVNAVLEVFQAFFDRHPQQTPNQSTATPKSSAAELQRQVTPSTSKVSTPSSMQNKRVYTSPEFESEMMRVVRLTKSGKFDDATRLESELNAAISEGRVRP